MRMLRCGRHYVASLLGCRRWSHVVKPPALLFGFILNNFASPQVIVRRMTTGFHIPSTFVQTRSEYPFWKDEELALPHCIYRDITKGILHTTSFRLKNKMINTHFYYNPLFTDLIENLMACDRDLQLIHTVIQQLEQLFPVCNGQNSEIRDHFILRTKCITGWMEMEALVWHPVLCSIDTRTSVISGSAQFYRNYCIREFEGHCSYRGGWQQGYGVCLKWMKAGRLSNVKYPLEECRFTNSLIAKPLNKIAAGVIAGLEARLSVIPAGMKPYRGE